jgi:hypothetical protein
MCSHPAQQTATPVAHAVLCPRIFTNSLFPLSRPSNEFFQPIQIQRPWHQVVSHNEAGSSRDAELLSKGPILINDDLPLTVHVEQIRRALGDVLHLVGKVSP